MIPRPVFCIVDPSLKDFVGHHFEYDRAVAEGVELVGFEALVLGHAEVLPEVVANVAVVPAFRRDIWGVHPTAGSAPGSLSDVLRCNRDLLADMRSALKRAPLPPGSVLFAHMITAKQLLAHAWHAFRTPGSEGISTILLLRYQPDFYTGRVCDTAFRLLERVVQRGGAVRLASDSGRLARRFERLTTLPVEVFPIPHTDSLEYVSSDHPALPARRPGYVRFVSLGNARDEKGYLEILQAIRLLRESKTALDGLEFVLQSNHPQADVAEAIAEFSHDLPPNVTLLRDALDTDAYRALLKSADVVLAPYWRSIYEGRTSGVFLEAAAAGKPVITTRDTWMSDEMARHGAGLLIGDRSAEELARAIRTAARDHGELAAAAARAAPQCREVHNATAFAKQATAPPRQCGAKTPPRRVAVLYPWGDLLERRTGAAVRCAAMVETLAAQVEEVRVLQPGGGLEVQVGNVRFEFFSDLPHRAQAIAGKAIDFLTRPLLGVKGEGQHQQLWFHIEQRLDPAFRRRVNELVRWADAVMLEYSYWGRVVLPLCREHGVPCIVSTYDMLSDQVTASALLRRATAVEAAWPLKRADRAICVSPEDQEAYGALGVSAELVANPVDLSRLDACVPGDERRLLRDLYDIELPNGPFGLFVGSRYAPNIVAADRIRALAPTTPGISWVVAGACAEPGQSEGFVALGLVDEPVLGMLYRLCTMVAVPLPYGTGTSLKTLEAMASGKPTIGTTAGFRGLDVTVGVHCLLEDDLTKYPALVAGLLADPGRSRALGAAARSFAESFDRWRLFQAYMPMLSLPAMTDEEIHAAQARTLKERELDLLRQVASRALERGHAAIVEGLLEALVARAPEDAGVRYLVGASLAREAATAEKALDHLRRAEELGNDAFQTRLAVVEAHRALGDEAAARRETERAVEVRVGSVLGAAQLGRFVVECWELHRQGRHRLVALLAAEMVRRRPDPGLYFLAAASREQLGEELEIAAGHFEAAVATGFDPFWGTFHLGMVLRRLGRSKEAQAALLRALALAASDDTRATAAAALVGQAWDQLAAGCAEQTADIADRLIAIGIEQAPAHYLAARARHLLDHDDEAVLRHYALALDAGFDAGMVAEGREALRLRGEEGGQADSLAVAQLQDTLDLVCGPLAAEAQVGSPGEILHGATPPPSLAMSYDGKPPGVLPNTQDDFERNCSRMNAEEAGNSCPICGCSDAALIGSVSDRPLLICRECRHLRWVTTPAPEELTAFYAQEYSGTHGQLGIQEGQLAYYRSHVAELAALADGRPGGVPLERLAIADVGCSFPVLLAEAVAAGCRTVFGVDWSDQARQYGAERGVPVLTPDAFLREVPDYSLDVLRYSHTLEHLPDPLTTLCEHVAKLRPGGLLYITQPNTPMLSFGAAPPPFDAVFPSNLQFFTPASAVALVERAGCTVERFYTLGEPETVSARHGDSFDLDYAVARLEKLEGRGEQERGPLNNFPFYFGRNLALYARRTGQPHLPPQSTMCVGRESRDAET